MFFVNNDNRIAPMKWATVQLIYSLPIALSVNKDLIHGSRIRKGEGAFVINTTGTQSLPIIQVSLAGYSSLHQ